MHSCSALSVLMVSSCAVAKFSCVHAVQVAGTLDSHAKDLSDLIAQARNQWLAGCMPRMPHMYMPIFTPLPAQLELLPAGAISVSVLAQLSTMQCCHSCTVDLCSSVIRWAARDVRMPQKPSAQAGIVLRIPEYEAWPQM